MAQKQIKKPTYKISVFNVHQDVMVEIGEFKVFAHELSTIKKIADDFSKQNAFKYDGWLASLVE